MNKQLYRFPLKLTGDRLLFIVVTWMFSITLTPILHFIAGGVDLKIGIYYSIATTIPYVLLLYYEAFDMGQRERNSETASMKNAFFYCLIFQIPSLIFFILYLLSFVTGISTSVIAGLFGGVWLAPFIGPRSVSASDTVNIIQFIIFMLVEWGFVMVSYYLGMKDILLIKPKKKKSSGSFKK